MKQICISNMITILILLSSLSLPDIDYKAYYMEQYIAHKSIVYRMWGIGPVYYDCWGIVTEALQKVGYRGFKLNSSWYLMDPSCKISASKVKKGDILINTNKGQGHVAFVSSNVNWRVKLLDFVKTHTRSSYRDHAVYPGVYFLSKDCLLTQKHWIRR